MTSALDLFSEFAVDEKAEQDGVWRDYGDISFLVARSGNRAYRQKFIRLYKPHERLLKLDTPASEAKSIEIMVDVMSTAILLNWKGKLVVEKGGAPVEYSVENAKKALGITAFRELIEEWSKDFDAFKAVKEEDAAKN